MRVTPSSLMVRSPVVPVTITSDLMCPWCWVGLRKLQEASKATEIDVNITWKPFLLRPEMPQEGVAKGGTPASRVPGRLKAAGQSVGINFTGLTDRTPNTVDFHAAMKYLLDSGMDQTPFQEAVFEAYFTNGVYPDTQALLDCADQVNVAEKVMELFESKELHEKYRAEVMIEAREASRRGIHGVPSFTFGDDSEPAFSGAQRVETFAAFLKRNAAMKATQESAG